ncbi:MAG TPA: hypothetical protein VHB21_21975, partial [Minicystis sp.]|nr:hypothetical protein [Minicystis sp.]
SDPPASAPPVSAAPGSAPPVTAGAQPGDGPALGGETVAASADEVSALRAAFATPFDKPSAKLARRQGAPPPPPPRAEAEQEREPARSGETSLVDAEEVERLRRLYAGPFSRRAATEPGAGAASPGASFLDVLGEEPEPDDG